MPGTVEYVNLGGGWGIPYFEKDQRLDLAVVGARLTELVDGRLAPALPDATVVIELGRYLVGEAGVYVTRVVDVKESRGRSYAVVDGGMHHQLAASGNFGQVIRRNYPVALAARATDEPTGPVTVVGCLCTPLDVLGEEVDLPAGRGRRPRRRLPGRRLRPDRQPDRVPGPPRTLRGARVIEASAPSPDRAPTDQSAEAAGGTSVMDTVTSQHTDSLAGVVEVLTRTLGIEDRAGSITRDTGLFGELPELDSLGVVELAAALEDRFDIVIDDDDFTGEVFETVGTLTDFVDGRLATAD